MTRTKKLYLFSIIALFLIPFLKSYACDLESDTRAPHITRYPVTGAKAFAEILEDSLLRLQGPFLLLSDVDGVVTDLSEPNRSRTSSIEATNGPSLWKDLGLIQEPRSRGDMVHYLQKLISQNVPVIFSSAWDKPKQTEARLSYLGLLHEPIERQTRIHTFERVEQLLPVTEEDLKKAKENGDMDWYHYLQNRSDQETFIYYFSYVQKGNCISVRAGEEGYYRAKAFAPDVYYKDNPAALKEKKTLIFMDDSETNIEEFLAHLPMTSYYSTLKNVIIFKFPCIAGEVRPEDTIAPEYLVSSSKIEKKEKL